MPTFTVRQIAERVGGDIDGPADIEITGLAQLAQALPGQLSFVRDDRHLRDWEASHATVALVTHSVSVAATTGRAIIRVADADLAMAKVLELFAPAPPLDARRTGIHAQATVDPTARIDATACIAAGVRIGPRVVVGARAVIHANVVILDDATIGADAILYPGVVVRERCELGERVILHPNVVIGADGFGYRPSPDGRGLIKIPHIGHVIIQNDVEIGAGSCVDRGKFSATVIGAGTKIDNLCQIAHNCLLGQCCIIAGNAGLAGSVTLGDGVMIGGGTSVKDHVTLGAGARIAGASAVVSDVPAGETWGGYPARPLQQTIRELAAMRRLPELVRLMKKLGRTD